MLPRESNDTLDDFLIEQNSTLILYQQVIVGSIQEQRYIHPSVKRSKGKCILTREDDDTISVRVEMSCGHPVTPIGLAAFVDYEIKMGKTMLQCPITSCKKEWKASEIIKRGLTLSEREALELGLEKNTFDNFRECPRCCVAIKKTDTGIKMNCNHCKSRGYSYTFCWSCKNDWKSTGTSLYACGNDTCAMNSELQKALESCETKEIDHIKVPKVRACPTCNKAIEHTRGCRRMVCPDCDTQFCHICLQTSNRANQFPCYYTPCKSAAARQRLE